MLGDLLFYAFTHALSENWLDSLTWTIKPSTRLITAAVGYVALQRVQRDDVERKFHFRAESWNLFDGSMTSR